VKKKQHAPFKTSIGISDYIVAIINVWTRCSLIELS